MDSSVLEQLKAYSKDDASYAKLKTLFEEVLSKLKKTQNELSLLENAIKNDYDSILITELDLEKPGPKIVYVNEGFTRMTGYTKDEVIGKTPRILQGPKTDRKVLDRLKKQLIDGQAFFGHTVNYKKDGREFINQWDIHPLTNEKGEITHWVSYQRDISEKSKTEKVIFDANLDINDLSEESKKTFVDLDIQGNIITSNKAFRDLFGYEPDELKSVKFWELVEDWQQKQVKELFQDNGIRDDSHAKFNWTFLTKQGKPLLLEINPRWFVNDGQDVIRLYVHNLTLRNKVIESLKFNQTDLDKLLNKQDEFTLKFERVNGDYECRYASEAFNTITGLSVEKVLGTRGLEVIHENDRNEVKKHIDKAFQGRCSTLECRYRTNSGETVSVIQHFNPASSIDSDQVDTIKVTGIVHHAVES